MKTTPYMSTNVNNNLNILQNKSSFDRINDGNISFLTLGNEIKTRLLTIFENPHSELEFNNVFELLIAVMLSAQCTDKRVNQITKGLFLRYKTPSDFANAKLEDIENEIKSCNYYHNKARNIIAMSKDIIERFNGQVPNTHDELISLKGVGNKTANVVLAVGFDKNALPVDTHVLRVSNRLGLCKTNNPSICEKEIKKYFKEDDYSLIHHLLLLFGRYNCKARNPNCNGCILKDLCKETIEN